MFEFGARDWGPQPVRSLLLNNSDALLTIVTAKDANIVTASMKAVTSAVNRVR